MFIGVKKATADMLLNGRTTGYEISHKSELDLCASAARHNVHLWHRLRNLRRPARLSHSSVHYLFNAALALQLYQILVESQARDDYEEVSFVISELGADESSNREYAKDCANVLADLSLLMGRLRRVDLSKSVPRGEIVRSSGHGLNSHSSIISSPSDGTGTASLPESHHHFPGSQAASDELQSGRPSSSPFDHREIAYNELLSWLETDNLQQRIDYPHRFG